MKIERDHFQKDLSDWDARRLFKDSVTMVEVETFTFCNRKCFFCPNAVKPERQDRANNRYMDESLYLRILSELASIDYQGAVTYSRYNEPLADRIILTRIRQARQTLPKAKLSTHTNGDYLTRAYLDELKVAGLNKLCVQTYLSNDEHWDEKKMLYRQGRQLARLGLRGHPLIAIPERHLVLTDYVGMEVTFDARNMDQIGTDRGGLVQLERKVQRRSPCFIPFQHLYVDFNGSVMPCCNLRSDVEEHRKYVVDSLVGGRSIFQAWANLADWRRELLTFGPKKAPCDTCAYEMLADSPVMEKELDKIAKDVGVA
jgi:hypothetical protein